jgi:hypothetical protein
VCVFSVYAYGVGLCNVPVMKKITLEPDATCPAMLSRSLPGLQRSHKNGIFFSWHILHKQQMK